MLHPFQLGLDTFGDVTVDANGKLRTMPKPSTTSSSKRVHAEEVGVDALGVGEHNRRDFSSSAPGGRTCRDRRSDAPPPPRLGRDRAQHRRSVRVFERFSTLNAIANGRAEVILGRGSFTESYPLFGYDLSNDNELFEERLAFVVQLTKFGPVTWSGRTRTSLTNQLVYPPVEDGPLRTWVGVGGSPESVVRAARYGLTLALAIIGGSPRRFRPYVGLYQQSLKQFGQPPQPVAVHSPGHVAATDDEARATELWPHYEAMMTRIGAERGWPPPSRAQFEREAGPDGALCVGSPETVALKIVNTARLLDLSRFNLRYSNGKLPHEKMLRSIELFGTQVAPRVRELLR